MEAVLLIGIQGAGKSTFYEQRLASTHVRVSLDIAGTRAREHRLVDRCLEANTSFAVDDTNATAASRAQFIGKCKGAGFKVIAFFFAPDVKRSLQRNAARSEMKRVPPPAIHGTLKRLQEPSFAEGFDEIYRVRVKENGSFAVAERLQENY